jgi:hypothetical protein
VNVSMTAGGTVDVASLGLRGGCLGYTRIAPHYRVDWTIQPAYEFNIGFTASETGDDATLIVRDPEGNWYCDDDSGDGFNPRIELSGTSGEYNIWVGGYRAGESVPGTLYVTNDCVY